MLLSAKVFAVLSLYLLVSNGLGSNKVWAHNWDAAVLQKMQPITLNPITVTMAINEEDSTSMDGFSQTLLDITVHTTRQVSISSQKTQLLLRIAKIHLFVDHKTAGLEFLEEALVTSQAVEDIGQRSQLMGEIAITFAESLNDLDRTAQILEQILTLLDTLSQDPDKQYHKSQIIRQAASLYTLLGQHENALGHLD